MTFTGPADSAQAVLEALAIANVPANMVPNPFPGESDVAIQTRVVDRDADEQPSGDVQSFELARVPPVVSAVEGWRLRMHGPTKDRLGERWLIGPDGRKIGVFSDETPDQQLVAFLTVSAQRIRVRIAECTITAPFNDAQGVLGS
jgi:hypothetical protein